MMVIPGSSCSNGVVGRTRKNQKVIDMANIDVYVIGSEKTHHLA